MTVRNNSYCCKERPTVGGDPLFIAKAKFKGRGEAKGEGCALYCHSKVKRGKKAKEKRCERVEDSKKKTIVVVVYVYRTIP